MDLKVMKLNFLKVTDLKKEEGELESGEVLEAILFEVPTDFSLTLKTMEQIIENCTTNYVKIFGQHCT